MLYKEIKNLFIGDDLNYLNFFNNFKFCYFMDILYLNDFFN